jgi:hypothetical protein
MTDKAKQIFWNCLAPVSDQDYGVIPGTAIKAGQEVIYSKIIRKMMGFDRKSWMELVMFSLVTSTTDQGMGAWYGEPLAYKEMGFMDVLQEVVRPIVSVLVIDYIFEVSYAGFHNPMKSFSFMNFLIALAAKDLATGGNALLAQKGPDMAAEKLGALEAMQAKMRVAARFRTDSKSRRSGGI